MGKKESWFYSAKKVFGSSSPRELPPKKSCRKGTWRHEVGRKEAMPVEHFLGQRSLEFTDDGSGTAASATTTATLGDRNRAISVAVASAAAAEAAAAAAAVAAAVKAVQLASFGQLYKEEQAAIVIQSRYRGYLARRALHALKGLVKLQALVRGNNARKQADNAMRCMQSLVRVQTRAREHRILSINAEKGEEGRFVEETNSRILLNPEAKCTPTSNAIFEKREMDMNRQEQWMMSQCRIHPSRTEVKQSSYPTPTTAITPADNIDIPCKTLEIDSIHPPSPTTMTTSLTSKSPPSIPLPSYMTTTQSARAKFRDRKTRRSAAEIVWEKPRG